ncbi:cupin domain-containing protein [Ostreiculturibacter nitratireducens]|uniref:cupin domain-containing protein n=1 Tax=Ostreiculturibacter nitratireducens TaxID=3075226 RepID=UPI0031B615C2
MTNFQSLICDAVEPEISRPEPDVVLAGDPVHTTWSIEEQDDLYAGIWESTPGKWRVSYEEWEYCRILSGVLIIAEDGGDTRTVRAGDSFLIRPGFTGTWEVVETIRKDYVIRL